MVNMTKSETGMDAKGHMSDYQGYLRGPESAPTKDQPSWAGAREKAAGLADKREQEYATLAAASREKMSGYTPYEAR